MKIHKITNGPLMQNCYVIELEGLAIVIDPGLKKDKILEYLNQNKLEPKAVLLTHGHFDHIFSAKALNVKLKAKNLKLLTFLGIHQEAFS